MRGRMPIPGLSRRRFVALGGAGALVSLVSLVSACGFQPLYGQRGSTPNAAVGGLRRVAVASIPERTGQVLRKELEFQLWGGRPDPRPTHRLQVSLGERITGQARLDDDSASFARLDLVARYELVSLRDGAVATQGETIGSASYNVVQSQFSNLSAQDGARERAALLVAGEISRRLALHFQGDHLQGDHLQGGGG